MYHVTVFSSKLLYVRAKKKPEDGIQKIMYNCNLTLYGLITKVLHIMVAMDVYRKLDD